jgi:cell division septation protein DedD
VTTDEGFREIQLNGKQLVFLFMAATVVSVVIFLCGVLVGRGVRQDRPAASGLTAAAVAPDPAAASPPQAGSPVPGPSAEPPAPADELTYYDRLQKNNTPRENLKSPSVAPAPSRKAPRQPPVPAPTAVPQPPAAETHPTPAAETHPTPAAEAHPTSAPADEPTGPGFAVQVTTASDRRSADTLVNQLVKKGYPAFATGPVTTGARVVYRVRVGKYKTAKEAEEVSKRLEKEEQFTTSWIVRYAR